MRKCIFCLDELVAFYDYDYSDGPYYNCENQYCTYMFSYNDGGTSHAIGNRGVIGKPPFGPRMVFNHRNKSFAWYESSLFVEFKNFNFDQPNVLEVKESYINFINKIIDNMDLM